MDSYFVKVVVTATIKAEDAEEARQALCDLLPDVDRYTLHTVTARRQPYVFNSEPLRGLDR